MIVLYPRHSMKLWWAAILAAGIGIGISLLLSGPSTRDNLNYHSVLPWPVFTVLVGMSGFLRSAADVFTPPAIRAADLTLEIFKLMAVYSCSRAQWPEMLDSGPKSGAELASEANISVAKARRLLRACVAWKVFHETTVATKGIADGDRQYLNTPLGDVLRHDHPYSMKALLATNLEDFLSTTAQFWDSVKNDSVYPFSLVHGYEHSEHALWKYYEEHPQQAAQFNRAMTAADALSIGALQHDFGWADKCATIVDLGGGRGSLLAALLTVAPNAKGILFDQPQVVAEARELWQQSFEDRLPRTTLLGGSFFELGSIPEGVGVGNSCYVYKAVLHDWADRKVLAILRNTAAAMRPTDRLLVIEIVQTKLEAWPVRALLDLQMMTFGGLERTLEEFDAIFGSAGLVRTAVHPTRSLFTIIEAARV